MSDYIWELGLRIGILRVEFYFYLFYRSIIQYD